MYTQTQTDRRHYSKILKSRSLVQRLEIRILLLTVLKHSFNDHRDFTEVGLIKIAVIKRCFKMRNPKTKNLFLSFDF